MTETEGYLIDLIAIPNGQSRFAFELDNEYFGSVEKSEAKSGTVQAVVTADVAPRSISLELQLSGCVQLVCDRCLDLMDYPVDLEKTFQVVLSESDDADDEDTVCVSRAYGKLDIAWLAYEQIIVNLPLVHCHREGECNPLMEELLHAHSAPAQDIE